MLELFVEATGMIILLLVVLICALFVWAWFDIRRAERIERDEWEKLVNSRKELQDGPK